MNQHKIILFDGVCNFCNFWVNFIIDRDKKDLFRFVVLQSEAGQKLLKKFGLAKSDFDTFILIDSKSIYLRSTAALKIVKDISGPFKFLSVFTFLPECLRDWIYDLVAINRYKIFGIRDVCRIPNEEERRKFL